MKNRYTIATWHGEIGSIFAVIDRKTDRVKGRSSTMRDGAAARQFAEIQRDALQRAEDRKAAHVA